MSAIQPSVKSEEFLMIPRTLLFRQEGEEEIPAVPADFDIAKFLDPSGYVSIRGEERWSAWCSGLTLSLSYGGPRPFSEGFEKYFFGKIERRPTDKTIVRVERPASSYPMDDAVALACAGGDCAELTLGQIVGFLAKNNGNAKWCSFFARDKDNVLRKVTAVASWYAGKFLGWHLDTPTQDFSLFISHRIVSPLRRPHSSG